ncbi:MAG TPA: substrate-binding domain-containing protein [Gemmataceae bacterium]|jgi:ribose transport system substrate-binding protein
MPRKAYLILAVAACLLGGCSRPDANVKYRIAVIPKGLTHEFWQSIHRGAERAAADLRAEGVSTAVDWDGPQKENETPEQIKLVQQKSVSGINGLVLAPQDSKRSFDCVKGVVEKGIPVVLIDSGLDPDKLKDNPNLIVKYVATNNYNGGRLAAKRLLEVLDKDGKTDPNLVLFRYAVGSESTEQREQGFLDYIEEQKKAGKSITLLSTDQYAGATVNEAAKNAGPLVLRYKDKLDGIFAVNESSSVGLLGVLRSQELNGKVRFVAFDSSEPLRQAIREGDVDGTIVQDPYRMGYLGVWMLVKHLEGYDVSAGGTDLGTGEYVVTKDNLDAEKTRGLFEPEMQAKRTIEKPDLKKK